MAVLDRHERGGEAGEFRRLVLVDASRVCPVDHVMIGQFEPHAGLLCPAFAIQDVTREAFLAAVDVDGGDALARFQQRRNDVHRGRGLARAAFFIGEHDDVRAP